MDQSLSSDERLLITQKTANLRFFKRGAYFIHRESYFIFITQILIISITVFNIIILNRNIDSDVMKYIFILLSSILGFLTVIFFILVSMSNPGFYNTGNIDEDKEKNTVVNYQNLFLRFCTTCKIVKDVRVFHCKFCNLCIERHGNIMNKTDHHCPWLSNCIGEKNHRLFLVSIAFLYFHTILVVAEQIYLIILLHKSNKDIKIFDHISVISILVISSVCFIFITVLLLNQFYFISKNITTSEYKRNKYGSGVYPFDKGVKINFKRFCCSIADYKRDITYNLMATNYLAENSLVYFTQGKHEESNKEDNSNLEMSFNTNNSKTF